MIAPMPGIGRGSNLVYYSGLDAPLTPAAAAERVDRLLVNLHPDRRHRSRDRHQR